ncbi:FAD-dependent monooxygenase [Leifsonia aquatica]|uniref:FAD-dependent monooxygenase n=1 Tax=Leifsonia aquatica TaxID=144185 RepID=UPI003824F824
MTSQMDPPHDVDIDIDVDVAVVGAGPVGLLLAGELAADGTHTVVLERSGAPSAMPKANGVVGHSALELDRRGVLAGTAFRVVSPPRFPFGPLPLDLGTGRDNPLHILPLPQRALEDALEARAVASGARVLRGRAVADFAQDDSAVSIDVRGGDTIQRVRARYLVGCDGARSLVRKHAGIAFPGFTADIVARIARVTIPEGRLERVADGFDVPGVGHLPAMRPVQTAGGGFSIAPVAALDPGAPSDLYLISTHEPRRDLEAADEVSVEELRASVFRVLGAELPFTAATDVRRTVGNSRQAEAYRAGRVFLAGDAAHIFNAGGSALNVGLADAIDLAGRLTAVLRGRASLEELDAYEAVRRPAGERALAHTRAQAALAAPDHSGEALRRVLGPLLAQQSTARILGGLLEDA